MIKNWKIFNEQDDYNRINNLNKFKYTEDDLRVLREIRSSSKQIKDDYGFTMDFSRFDAFGLPFIDLKDEKHRLFAVYHIKERRFALFSLDNNYYKSTSSSSIDWKDISSKGRWMSKNMNMDGGYLYIKGGFFEEIERLYYIYYQ